MNNLELLNKEEQEILFSKEYLLGRKILKFKYYIKHFKFITLFKKIFNQRKINKYLYKKDNYNNDTLFKDNDKKTIKSIDKNEKIAVYTVNIGGYDNLIMPLTISDNIDYYVVSDIKPKELGIFKWIDANKYINNLNVSNVKKARYLKTHPHLIFKNYKYSIFIDGNIRCISDISKFVSKINKDTKIAIHPHPYRDCIYKELLCCKITLKGNYKVMKQQVEEYKRENMPKEFGLFETNVLIREHNDLNCINIMEKWWDEILNKSERDQLSLTYVLWKLGYVVNDIGNIANSIKNNYAFQVVNHIEEYDK
ncbi:MAG: DUF616 domain-containing protein [Bacilli bacterium]|nr:DUF616 domain-containing protein [Bacilli bacterium]